MLMNAEPKQFAFEDAVSMKYFKFTPWRGFKIALIGGILFLFVCLINIFIHKVHFIFFLIPWLFGMIGAIDHNINIFKNDE